MTICLLLGVLVLVSVKEQSDIVAQGRLRNLRRTLQTLQTLQTQDEEVETEVEAITDILRVSTVSRDLTEHPDVMEYLKTRPVFVSITSSPDRVRYLRHVFDHLDLTHVSEILLTLPTTYGKKKEKYVFDEEIFSRYPGTVVKRLQPEVDSGPISKLVPAALYVRNEKGCDDCVLITLDDDIGYPVGALNELIYTSVKHRVVATLAGHNLRHWNLRESDWPRLSSRAILPFEFEPINIIEGMGAVVYQPRFIDDALMLNVTASSKWCMMSDDVVISYALSRSGVPAFSLNNEFASISYLLPYKYGKAGDALHVKHPNNSKYPECLKYLGERARNGTLPVSTATVRASDMWPQTTEEPVFPILWVTDWAPMVLPRWLVNWLGD